MGLTLSAHDHDFGAVVIGTSANFTLEITNWGDDTVWITRVEDNYADSVVFTTDFNNQSGVRLAVSASLPVAVTFNPNLSQHYSSTLTISTDDADNPSLTVALTGTGVTQPTAPTWSGDVFPIIRQNCISCHGSSGGYSLESYNDAMRGGRITPGDAQNSTLVKRLEGRLTPQMPLGGSLAVQQIAAIRAWIDDGARNN